MKSIEIFAGAGGLGMGAHRAGFEPVLMLEWDRWCCSTLRHNFSSSITLKAPQPTIIEDDVRNIDFALYEGQVDFVSGGPPCQPFSLGGKHRAYADIRDMFPQAIRTIEQVKPKAFMFENVKGLTRASFSSYYEYIKLRLEYPSLSRNSDESWIDHLSRLEEQKTSGTHGGLRYNVVARVINAANYGVPQRRERIFFVGFRSDLGIDWHFPEEEYSKDALEWTKATGEYWELMKVPLSERSPSTRKPVSGSLLFKKPWITVRQALEGLPDAEQDPKGATEFLNHQFQPGARSYAGHTGSPLDEPAKTLKAGVHGVPGGENMLRRPDGSVRYFSVRESARLQTFPDNFCFHGAWSEAMRQLGNAVPVSLAEKIARNIREALTICTSA